ncbi:MAG: decarboxylase [Candidatus Thiodiazotropha sp.]
MTGHQFQGGGFMPYFIFKIDTENRLEYIGEEEKYRPARERVRTLRAGLEAHDGSTYRMVFANTVGQGEKLLAVTEHDDKIIGDD